MYCSGGKHATVTLCHDTKPSRHASIAACRGPAAPARRAAGQRPSLRLRSTPALSSPAPPGREAPLSLRAAWQFSCRRALRQWGRRRRRRRAARQGVRAQAGKPLPPSCEPPLPPYRVARVGARLRARVCEERGFAQCCAGKGVRHCATEKCGRPTEMSSPAGAGAAQAGAAAEASMRHG